MTGRPIERYEYDDALRRVYSLPRRQQLALYQALRSCLAAGMARPMAADEQIDRQLATLAVMQEAAAWHNLPEGQSPTPDQLTEACRELGLD